MLLIAKPSRMHALMGNLTLWSQHPATLAEASGTGPGIESKPKPVKSASSARAPEKMGAHFGYARDQQVAVSSVANLRACGQAVALLVSSSRGMVKLNASRN